MATKNIVPNADGEGQLGTSSKSWAQGHIDSITGTIATAAQGSITSLGTLTALTVDSVIVNGTTIGHTGDTDLLTLTDGKLNVSGKIGIGVDPTTLLHLNGTGDAIRVESTNAGAGGAQMDLLHFSASPADNDVMGAINMGGYYSGTSSAYFGAIKTVATDISARSGELQFFTNNSSTFTKQLTITSGGDVLINATSKHTGYTASTTLKVSSNSGDYFPILEFSGNRDANNGNQNAMIQFWNKTSTAVEVGRITSSQGSGVNYGELQFATASNGTLTERLRIKSGGDVTVNTGNLIIGTAGKGIDFSAETPSESGAGSVSTDGSLLDDYEEGTWVPVYDGSTSGVAAGYSSRSGVYTKIGRNVTVTCNIVLSDKSGPAGFARISGLPFAGVGSPAWSPIAPVFNNLSIDANQQGTGAQYATNPFVYLLITEPASGLVQMGVAKVNNTTEFNFTLTYMTNT
tara:strand:- start:11 stop:1390 length:1380 start_codon:yes stop_codon:yes gene_type:complete